MPGGFDDSEGAKAKPLPLNNRAAKNMTDDERQQADRRLSLRDQRANLVRRVEAAKKRYEEKVEQQTGKLSKRIKKAVAALAAERDQITASLQAEIKQIDSELDSLKPEPTKKSSIFLGFDGARGDDWVPVWHSPPMWRQQRLGQAVDRAVNDDALRRMIGAQFRAVQDDVVLGDVDGRIGIEARRHNDIFRARVVDYLRTNYPDEFRGLSPRSEWQEVDLPSLADRVQIRIMEAPRYIARNDDVPMWEEPRTLTIQLRRVHQMSPETEVAWRFGYNAPADTLLFTRTERHRQDEHMQHWVEPDHRDPAYHWQDVVLNDAAPVKIVFAGRRAGKTALCVRAYRAEQQRRAQPVYVTSTLREAQQIRRQHHIPVHVDGNDLRASLRIFDELARIESRWHIDRETIITATPLPSPAAQINFLYALRSALGREGVARGQVAIFQVSSWRLAAERGIVNPSPETEFVANWLPRNTPRNIQEYFIEQAEILGIPPCIRFDI